MELSAKQQAVSAINKAKNILLISEAHADGDSVGATLAFYLAMKKIGKKVTLACAEEIPAALHFLPCTNEFVSEISKNREFVIDLDVSKVRAKEVRYETLDNHLKLIITPEDGEFCSEDIKFEPGRSPFDLLIVFDSADIDRIGKIYDENTQLFFETPLLVIDHHSSNEFYGEINLVEVTATSTCEILVSLLEALDPKIIDEDIATCLMTGLVSDTGSFQHSNTTPKSLTIAAQLSASGARHQEIVRNLFKTKSYSQLCLWGRVLSRLRHDPEYRLVWSFAKMADYSELGAGVDETTGLIDELMTSAPDSDFVILISEREPNEVYGSIRSTKGIDSIPLAQALGGGGHPGAAGFKLSGLSVEAAEEHVLAVAREIQGQRLGIEKTENVVPRIEKVETAPVVIPEVPSVPQATEQEEQIATSTLEQKAPEMVSVGDVLEEKKKSYGLWGEAPKEKVEKIKEESDLAQKETAVSAVMSEVPAVLQTKTDVPAAEPEAISEEIVTSNQNTEKSVADLLKEVAEEFQAEKE